MRREAGCSGGSRRSNAWPGGRAGRVAALAAAVLSGCGPSLFDAGHLPVHIPACTAAEEPVACAGLAACVAEDDQHCGVTCTDCLATPIQHGTASCDRSSPALDQHVCATTCQAGYVRDPSGPGCVCDVGQVACGAAGACVAETAAACGSTCQVCTAPAGATPTCASHRCDYLCPGGKVQCTSAAGQPDCCAPACVAPEVQCGSACVGESTTQCGPRCVTCADPATNPVPANAAAACLGPAGQGACSFACNPGFLKSNGACVQVAAGRGTVALGATHTCVLTTAGGVMCWGNNGSGQLGLGDTANRLTPVDVPLAGGATAAFLAAGTSHTCAVTTAGEVQCWGSNATGQLAQPVATTPSSLTPLAVPGLTGVRDLAAGAGHTCALLVGGGVSCWGANDKSQATGVNPPTAQPVTAPVAVNLSGAVSAVATQLDHTCVIKASDKHVLCWGSNVFGQTGQSAAATSTPAQVSSVVADAIAVGGTHTCIIGTLGNAAGVYCWGNRSAGQVGDGVTATNVNAPQLASKLTPASGAADRLITGLAHTCVARAADGFATCAGANLSLQVGSSPPSSSVLQGPSITLGAMDALFGGGDRGCALSAGVLACWGANDHGQLGNGTTAETATPVSPQPF